MEKIKVKTAVDTKLKPITGLEFFIVYLICQIIILINFDSRTNIAFMILIPILFTIIGLRRINSLDRPWQHIFYLFFPLYNIYFLIFVLFLENIPKKK